MCIVCNAPVASDDFLGHFRAATHHMRKAREAMLKVKEEVDNEEVAAQYDKAHKQMVRISREWNGIEHFRELET